MRDVYLKILRKYKKYKENKGEFERVKKNSRE